MAPPAAMRGMIHSFGRKAIGISFAAGVGGTLAFFFGYVQPRHEKYEQFFKSYDPYVRMKEICESNKGYMHTCPQDLARAYEEKGKEIAPLKETLSVDGKTFATSTVLHYDLLSVIENCMKVRGEHELIGTETRELELDAKTMEEEIAAMEVEHQKRLKEMMETTGKRSINSSGPFEICHGCNLEVGQQRVLRCTSCPGDLGFCAACIFRLHNHTHVRLEVITRDDTITIDD